MKYFYFLLVIFLIPFFSFAQSNFKPGYVVTLTGDTLHGFINYKEWAKNPTQFDFKKDISSAANIYNISNAKGFGVDGFESYSRFVLPISRANVNTSQLSVGADTGKTIETVFLRMLNTGKNITLYVYSDKIKEHFFISEGNGQPYELIYNRFLDVMNNSNVITIDTYKQQLQRLAIMYQPGNSSLTAVIQNVDYAESSLYKISAKINGSEVVQYETSSRKSIKFFAGLALNNSTINSTAPAGINVSKSASPFFPKANVGVDFLTNKNVSKLIFRVELSFTGSKDQFTYSGKASNGVADFSEVLSFNQYITALDPQILYNIYNSETIKFYVALGANVSYCTYTNKKDMYTDLFDNSPATSQDFPGLPNILFDVSTKAGLSFNNKFEIYAGYNLPSNITGNYQYTLKLNSYQAGVNYLFGGN